MEPLEAVISIRFSRSYTCKREEIQSSDRRHSRQFKAVQCVSSGSSFGIRHSGREYARGPARNGASLRMPLTVSCDN
jgi:hypothetical protein